MRLEARDVQCGWEDGKPVQRYVSFSVENGQVCCILGPNGCGKSTLMKTMLGLLPRQSGSITIDGRDVAKFSPKDRAKVLAYVSQAHRPPFAYRVRDVVLLGRTAKLGAAQPSAADYEVADNALADMGVYHLRNALYTDISGGELQLVMIARAIAQQPQIIVLDEPTAALDYGNAMRVIGKLRELSQMGYGVLMTTHSPDHAFMLDSNVLLLQRNKPMQFGRAVDIITEQNMRSAYGVDVETKEFITRDGEVMRMCAPVFKKFLKDQKAAVSAPPGKMPGGFAPGTGAAVLVDEGIAPEDVHGEAGKKAAEKAARKEERARAKQQKKEAKAQAKEQAAAQKKPHPRKTDTSDTVAESHGEEQ